MTTTTDFSKSKQEAHIDEVNEQLARLAGGSLKMNEIFRDHDKSWVAKPVQMTIEEVVHHGSKVIEAEAQEVDFVKTFKARPNDGAVAFQRVLTETYGFGALGRTIRSFFGDIRPEYRTVTTGLTIDADGEKRMETVEVPWGLMEFTPLEAKFMLHEDDDPYYGRAFTIHVTAKKKRQPAINGLFMLVEEYLKKNSIYRNKALFGVGRLDPHTGAYTEPEFTNPYETNREQIVYSSDVWASLYKNVLTRILHTDECRKDGVSIGAKILLHGENGTGKTEFTKIVGQYALENGWGHIQARYDEDVTQVLNFAERLGTPTLVCVEDVEKLIPSDGSPEKMDKLLDAFDGAGSKGREVILVMTSNHADELTRSMTRAGRIDRMIPVGALDREAVERLVNVIVPAQRREDLDYEQLHVAYEGYTPSWIMESLKGLKLAAIARTGQAGEPYATEDFVIAAQELRPAWEHHQMATDRPEKEEFGVLFSGVVEHAVRAQLAEHYVDVSNRQAPILVKQD